MAFNSFCSLRSLLLVFLFISGTLPALAQPDSWLLSSGTRLVLSGSGAVQGIRDEKGNVLLPEKYKHIHVLYRLRTEDHTREAFLFLGIKAGEMQKMQYTSSVSSGDDADPYGFSFPYTVFPGMLADLYTVGGDLILENLNDLQAVFSNRDDTSQHFYSEQGYFSLSRVLEAGTLNAALDLELPVRDKPFLLSKQSEEKGTSTLQRFFYDPSTALLYKGTLQDFMEIDQGIFLVNNDGLFGIYRQGTGFLLEPEFSALQFETKENGELVFPMVVKKDGYYGVLSAPGKWLIAAEFHNLIYLRDFGFVVEKGTKWQVNKRTDTLFFYNELDRTDHSEFVTTSDSVLLDALSGFYNLSGKKIIPLKYNRISTEGEFLLAEKGKRIALAAGEWTGEEMRFSEFGMYYDDYLSRNPLFVESRDLYAREKGLLMKNIGNWQAEAQAAFPGMMQRSDALVVMKKNKWGVLATNGKWILPPAYTSLKKVRPDQFSSEREFFIAEKEKRFGLFSPEGKEILLLSFTSLEAHVFTKDSLGEKDLTFIATMGGAMQTVEGEIFNLGGYTENISEEKLVGAKYVLYDREGQRRNVRTFDTLVSFHSDAYFMFGIKDQQGLIRLDGEIIIPPDYAQIRFLGDHFFEASRESYAALFRGSELLLSGSYSGFDWINDQFFRVRSGSQYGLYSIREKKLILPVEYDFLYTSGDYFIVGRDMKKGYADSSGNLILPAVYDDIEVDPQGFAAHVMRVTEKGKCGYFDKQKKSFITPPAFDISSNYAEQDGLYRVNIGGEAVMGAFDEVVSVKGGKWGMVNNMGELVLAAEFDAISPFASDVALFRCVKAGSEFFYDAQGKPVLDGKKKWEQSLSGRWMKIRSRDKMKVEKCGGPPGADATAFYLDKQGHYWLGTGSSGGVYFSSDKGVNWEERNEGIGPAHVYLLLGRNDSLYAMISSSEERFDDYSSVQVTEVFCYNFAASSWMPVFPRDEDYLNRNILLSADLLNEKYRNDSRESPDPFLLWSSGSARFSEDHEAFNYYNIHHYDALLDFRKGRADTLRENWPFDMLHNAGGNVFAEGEDLILLAKSGLYRMQPDNSIVPLEEKGLVASDITQSLVLPDGKILLREGEQDIWKYDGKKFSRIIDNYAFNLNRKKVPYTRSTRTMFAAKNGNTYVVVADQLLRIAPDGKQKILFTSGDVSDVTIDFYDYPSYQMQVMEAMEDESGQVWCLTQLVQDSQAGDGIYLLARLDEKSGKLIPEKKHFIYPEFTNAFFFSSPDYRVFLCYDQWLIDFRKGDTTELPYSDSPWFFYNKNSMAMSRQGDLVLQSDQRTLLVYNFTSRIWQQYNYEGMMLQTFGFDRDGHLYAASANRYMFYCDGFADLMSEARLYRFYAGDQGAEWEVVPNGINPKILHISADPAGGLLLGTSGSGLLFLKKR